MGIHYNRGAELLDYVLNKDDFQIDEGYIHALSRPGLGVEVDEARLMSTQRGKDLGRLLLDPFVDPPA